MSTPDPRTEAIRLAVRRYRGPSDHDECINDLRYLLAALTTEAARVRGETWREAAKQVAFYNCDHNHGVAATKACDDLEDQFLKQATKAVVKDSLTTEIATPKPTWSTARPTVAGWYWWRSLKGNEPEVVHLIDPDIVMLAGDDRIFSPSQMVNGTSGEWCPIARPSEEVG